MNRWLSLLVCTTWLSACSSEEGSSSGGGGSSGEGAEADAAGEPDDAELNGIVKLHNEWRAEVGTAPLEWSAEVASIAKAYAEKCEWGHNDDRNGYGENIYASSGQSSPSDVVGSWAAEKKDYDASSGKCASGKVCGHYTQIVWSSSKKLGCGKARCESGSPMGGGAWDYWVCNYDPPGNYSGQKAF